VGPDCQPKKEEKEKGAGGLGRGKELGRAWKERGKGQRLLGRAEEKGVIGWAARKKRKRK
jgi:hypothetical protein